MAEHNVCETCGKLYVNFCVSCARRFREEKVEELMEACGLTEENLIHELADQVFDGNFSALNLAIAMKQMKPATRTDVTSGGKPLDVGLHEAKHRLGDKLARLAKRQKKE